MPTPSTDRLAALAGPAALVSLLLLFAALAVHGDAAVDLSRSALGVASSALGLVSTGLLLLGLARLAAHPQLQGPGGSASVLVAGGGTLLLAGGAWAQLVVLPVLAVEAPSLAEGGSGLVTAGYVASFLTAGVGWLLVALRLRGDASLSRAGVRLLLAGSVLMLAPLPTRWVFLALAVTLLVRRKERTPATAPVPALG